MERIIAAAMTAAAAAAGDVEMTVTGHCTLEVRSGAGKTVTLTIEPSEIAAAER